MAPQITTTAELESYITVLTATGIPTDLYKSITLLTGGTANYVWRLTMHSGSTLILKHAEPFIASNPSMAFPVDRMDFEARALRDLPPLLLAAGAPTAVQPVPLIEYVADDHMLWIADGGPRHLKDAYSDRALDVRVMGRDIGTWLATLHAATVKTDIGDNRTAKFIYRHSYRNLHTALAKFGFDVALAERVDEEFGALLASDDEVICHGDFWPGNVLVGNDEGLMVADWEMARRGCGATDVGQFAAEAFLLDRFRGGRGLREAFLGAYAEARGNKLDREFLKRMAVHWGVHVAFWPTRVEWADEEETRELVVIGVKALNAILEEDWETVGKSELFEGVEGAWKGLWET
ncbi:kinase-like protein [Mytilinidion resinicola]|uniref:Kinase-like protein n=1 Tax=Mytilinidion resinicola TaxID=574789 RepID=A0A6A6YRU3_9PEZI|nr:kinase-like protein [Mytilinidion resinicola]KAF2811239.1 kinase-like protein [Mytilinidion resinicola]